MYWLINVYISRFHDCCSLYVEAKSSGLALEKKGSGIIKSSISFPYVALLYNLRSNMDFGFSIQPTLQLEMPRISPKTFKEALRHSRLLPPLLRAAPLEQAKQELKWIQQELPQNQWPRAVQQRSKSVPLQYILKSQPFGPLDIVCGPGVLIPRWETEEWCLKLSQLLAENTSKSGMKILDACTGTGCIPLLLNYELNEVSKLGIPISGFDISPQAYSLALENLQKYESLYPKSGGFVTFNKKDLFNFQGTQDVDLIAANPPYIPISDYNSSVRNNGVERSVRKYEPALALVGENEFYEALVELVVGSSAKGFVFELGYDSQAHFVVEMLKNTDWTCGVMDDSSGNVRCVVGWKQSMSYLQGMCNR